MFKLFLIIFIYFFLWFFSYALKITEVYFDWTDEYIWIYSKDWFSGNIEISWAKSSNIKKFFNINKNEEIILWDDSIEEYFSWYNNFKTWFSLSISDTKKIDISLLYSWNIVDNFFVWEDEVNKFNNKKTAFEKIFSWDNEIVKAVENSINMTWWYIWNPWYVQIYNNENATGNNYLDCWYYILKLDNDKNIKDCSLAEKEIISCYIKLDSKENNNTYNLSFTWNKYFDQVSWLIDNNFYKTWLSLSISSWSYIKAVWNYGNETCTWSFYIDNIIQLNSNNTDNNHTCNIIYQSFNDWKLNLSLEVSDKKICDNSYTQVWAYSWWITTWICDSFNLNIKNEDQKIEFKIYSWEKLICKDIYNFFYKEQLNCSIKIQWTNNYFFDTDSLNFISIINDEEIQNSNKNYTCKYFLNDDLLSDECNPSSIKFSFWLHKIKLFINSKNWLTCQSFIDLNIPKLSKNDILQKFNIDDFQELIQKLKTKYSDTSLKTIIQPLDYLYNKENYVKNLNSDELKQLVEIIKNKYKSDYTLKNIFYSISYLYNNVCNEIQSISIENCAKLNSDELKSLIQKISEKYKTNYTLEKIFEPINFLYVKNNSTQNISWDNINNIFTWNIQNQDFIWNLKIVKILPNPTWKDIWNEIIILSWNFLTWIYIWTEKSKYNLSNYILTWKNYLFTWNFWFTNKSKCVNLYYNQKIIDSICYLNAQEWKFIDNFIKQKNDLIFVQDYMILKNKIIENKPLIKLKDNLKSKLKEKIKIINEQFKKLSKKNKKSQKDKNKIYNQFVKILIQYSEYKNKYSLMKNELENKNKKKYYELIEKNNEIKNLKNINTFLRSFIVYVKKHIPQDIYRQYLDNYKQAKLWKKMRF